MPSKFWRSPGQIAIAVVAAVFLLFCVVYIVDNYHYAANKERFVSTAPPTTRSVAPQQDSEAIRKHLGWTVETTYGNALPIPDHLRIPSGQPVTVRATRSATLPADGIDILWRVTAEDASTLLAKQEHLTGRQEATLKLPKLPIGFWLISAYEKNGGSYTQRHCDNQGWFFIDSVAVVVR
jgi:hypothetical protein